MSPSRPLLCLVALSVLFAAPAAQAQEAALGTFADVPLDHWAFLTVELLVRKYKVMAGFPDASFRGANAVTRYELAAALEKVVSRMEGLTVQGVVVAPADVAAVRAALKAIDLAALNPRLTQLETDTQALADKGLRAVTVTGGAGLTWLDNTQDTVNPFFSTGFGIDLSTTKDGVEMAAGMGGGIAGAQSGNKPATAGSDKPPSGFWNFGQAHLTSRLADVQVRTGLFEPGSFFGAGTDLPGTWDGLVGNGLQSPNRNTVRWGDKSVALAATREFGKVKATLAATSAAVLGGLDLKVNEFVRLKVTADTDQPDWWGAHPNQAVTRNVFGTVDLGTSKLGLNVQGGLAKDLIQAGAYVTWNPWSDMRLGVGAVYRTSEKVVSEVTPSVAFYVPSYARVAPSVLVGVKEPQVVSTTTGNTGPGSLLGQQAGATILLGWQLEDLGFPNVKFEYNIQQPVLFYSIYDATFALDVGRGF